MTRVVAISDLHGLLPPRLPECDLLLIAGDVCPDTPASGWYARRELVAPVQAEWLRREFTPWLEKQPAGATVMCWGNHDYVGEFPALVPDLPAVVLTDTMQNVGGLRIYGMPWTHFLPSMWAFDVPPTKLHAYIDRIPSEIDVLVTHGPPFGVCDRTVRGDRAGSQQLADAVARMPNLRLHVFGHIHEARGQSGRHFNVSLVDVHYRPYPLPVTTIRL